MRIFKDCQNCSNEFVRASYNQQRQLSLKNSKLKYEIDRLTNNWNELEEWLKEDIIYKDEVINYKYQTVLNTQVLDKMNEIKESNK